MRFSVLFATLLLAACGLPGTGPGQWMTMPPIPQAQVADEDGGTRPPLPDPPRRSSVAERTVAAAERTATVAAPRSPSPTVSAAPADRPTPAAGAAAEPARAVGPAQAEGDEVEVLSSVSLSDPQIRAVEAALRDSWRDEAASLQRIAAGRNTLGVVFVCGYAEIVAGGERRNQAFRGVMIGRDRAQPRFAPATDAGTDERTTAELCREQGIPLSAAEAVATAPAVPDAPAEAAPAPAQPVAVAEAPVLAAQAGAASGAAAAAAPLPRVPLSESHINAVKTGVKASLKADAPVFGRMLAGADAKGGIVVCGYVSPGEDGALQPFTGVLIGEGDARKFVPVGLGRNPAEQRETMDVCARQGIPL
jgi:hypothetical protein